MDQTEFLYELEAYNLADLELIWKTQQTDYTMEELAVIKELLDKRRKEHAETEQKQSYTVQCVLSLLIPVIGFVLGILFLHGRRPEQTAAGRRCLIAAMISVLLWLFLLNGGFRMLS